MDYPFRVDIGKAAHLKMTRKSAPGGINPPKSRSNDAGAAEGRLGQLAAALNDVERLTAELAAARAQIDELQAQADTDFLLNILNRRGFERELQRARAYIRRYRANGALIALDVDRLKPVNDAHGHAAGDVVLKGVAALLMRFVRESDVLGRLGGDEFGLLLWNLTEADALAKAAAIEAAIDELTFPFNGHSLRAGASAGVAMLNLPDEPIGTALDRADQAMYRRKAERRGDTLRAPPSRGDATR